MTKIAMVGPAFFSYIPAICQELQIRGIDSSFFDERHSNSIFSKILYRFNLEWLFIKKKRAHLNLIKTQINEGQYTDVILTDTEVVDKQFVLDLKKTGVRVHLYMWDNVKNKPGFLHYYQDVMGRGSFDMDDCKNYGLKYIPLFAENIFSQSEEALYARDVDLSFCGTLHSNRAFYLKKLAKIGQEKGLKLELMTFFHSKWLLACKSLKGFSNLYFLKTVSTSGFSKPVVAKMMQRSKYVFDIQHKNQQGLTIRTFEALRCGAHLITFNKNVYSLPELFHDRILLINDVNDIKDMQFSDTNSEQRKYKPISKEADYFLSISRFVDELLDMIQISREVR